MGEIGERMMKKYLEKGSGRRKNIIDDVWNLIIFYWAIINYKSNMKGSKVQSSGKGSQKVAKSSNWKDRISQNDYEELKATFDLFDADGGGTIDP